MIDLTQVSRWFEAHAAALALYARQWVERAEAEDVVQEVFFRLLREAREPEQIRAWLFRAVRNEAISAGRSRKRRIRRERRLAGERGEWFEMRLENAVDAAAAESALQALAPEQRELVVLRIWGQMSFQEMSDVTGKAISTVHDQYRAALAAVRRRMESSCGMKES